MFMHLLSNVLVVFRKKIFFPLHLPFKPESESVLYLQEQGLFHSTLPKSSLIHVSTAEKKLLIVFTYYIFLYVISELNFTLAIQIADSLQTKVFSYFICEKNGCDPSAPCDRSGFENLLNHGIILLSSILSFLAPAVNFVFVVDYQELKQKFNNLRSSKKTTRKTSGNELQSRTITQPL